MFGLFVVLIKKIKKLNKYWVPEGSLAGNFRVGFPWIFGQTWPQDPSRSPGLALQLNLHEKSAPQTNSKAISWRQQIPGEGQGNTALISAMCVCALGVRALLISVFCCFGPFCGRGRPQDLVERVGFEISCRNQGSLPSGIGSKAIFGVGDRHGGPSCVIRKNGLCVPQRSLKFCVFLMFMIDSWGSNAVKRAFRLFFRF